MLRFIKISILGLLISASSVSLAESLNCPPLDANGKRRIDAEAITQLETCIKESPISKSKYFDEKTKQYTPERKTLHERIIQKMVADKPCNNKNPIAILTGGLPGSGKTSFIKNNLPWINSKEFIMIDLDTVREQLLPEYQGWNNVNMNTESWDIAEKISQRFQIPCKHNIFYDSTMSNDDLFKTMIEQLKKDGYEIYVLYMKVPVDIAKKRALIRYQESGRYVPQAFIDAVDKHGDTTFNKIRSQVDGYWIVDGTTGKIIAKGGKDFPTKS